MHDDSTPSAPITAGPKRPGRRRWLSAFAAIALSAAMVGCSVHRPETNAANEKPRNIIIMFADGATFSQWDFGQYSSRVLRQQPFAVTEVVLREGVSGAISHIHRFIGTH